VAKRELQQLFEREDHVGLSGMAGRGLWKVLRYLIGRLYAGDEEKWRAVRALGALCSDPQLVSEETASEMMRRFLWALNDESGAVPYGIPEAMGEIMVQRSELQKTYLPILCSMLTAEEMLQTGPVERGLLWAVGRVGPPVVSVAPDAVLEIEKMAKGHADDETRRLAVWALAQMGSPPGGPG